MLRVVFRVDASREIGTGHVMRCLALADGLRRAGATCRFICRAHDGHLGARIADEGFAVTLLPPGEGARPEAPPPHAGWAGVDWARDAADTRAALGEDVPDWMVVDHYALDARWEAAACPDGTMLLVIDDLADRPHECDLLIDQTLGRGTADYAPWLEPGVPTLIGPDFALLRPDFAALRAETLARRERGGVVRRVLVTMGGVDRDNVTGRVLDGLDAAPLPEDATITVVMGPTALWENEVRARAARMGHRTEVVAGIGVAGMARLMADSDLAVGAGGTTTWERCTLGLPAVIVRVAENQAGIAHALVAQGAAMDPGAPGSDDFRQGLVRCIGGVADRLQPIGAKAATLCDGEGVGRVVARMVAFEPTFRPATVADSRRVWEWRAASDLARFSRSGANPGFAEHHAWFAAALADQGRLFRILTIGGLACGYVRLDRHDGARAMVSLCLAPDMRGRGLASAVLDEARRMAGDLRVTALDAEVHVDNTASLRCFAAAGYRRCAQEADFARFSLELERIE